MSDRFTYEDLLEIPFVEKGRDPKVGLDCWGYCMELARRAGKELPEIEEYTANVEGRKLSNPQPFCLVALKLEPPFVSHVGFAIDERRFTHIWKKGGVTTARLNSPFYRDRIAGYYAI